MTKVLFLATTLLIAFAITSCNNADTIKPTPVADNKIAANETPEYFNLRPSLEKKYGYSHAVKMGDHIKISGAVSMDTAGVIIGAGNMDLQMRNCYKDLETILKHYGCTFDDVYAENIYTTNMMEFERVSDFRNTIYKKQFPTGTWLEVKGLALVNQLIEIDMEARKIN